MNNENCLKILTVNWQGLGDISNRREIFRFVKSKIDHIYFFYDTNSI